MRKVGISVPQIFSANKNVFTSRFFQTHATGPEFTKVLVTY